jgi:hypothetical protein
MPATDWRTLAKNHIPARDWNTISNVWGAAAIGFDVTDLVDLSEQLNPILAPGFNTRDNVSVFDFPGRHVASFQDATAALLKCTYLLRAVGNCIIAGQPTWGAVDAYHFSFVAGRALLAFLGINFVQIGDTYCFVDVFPEGRLDREKAQFRKHNPATAHPARLIFRVRSSPIEQRGMWTILIRALRVTNLGADVEADLNKICELSDGFGKTRNELLYRNLAWVYEEDRNKPSRDVKIKDDIHSYSDLVDFFINCRDANYAFAAIFARVLSKVITTVRERSGVDILQTSYGPCLKRFSGFNLQSLEALYQTVYQKQGFSVDL